MTAFRVSLIISSFLLSFWGIDTSWKLFAFLGSGVLLLPLCVWAFPQLKKEMQKHEERVSEYWRRRAECNMPMPMSPGVAGSLGPKRETTLASVSCAYIISWTISSIFILV